SAGGAYLTGYTTSQNFPTTIGAFQTSAGGHGGGQDAFVTKLNPTGSGLVYSTFLGGSGGTEQGRHRRGFGGQRLREWLHQLAGLPHDLRRLPDRGTRR